MNKLFGKDFTVIHEDFQDAQHKACELFGEAEDGGTCNLDSVLINVSGIHQKTIDDFNRTTLIIINHRLSGIWKGYAYVGFSLYGQGNRRTKMMESIYQHLKNLGYPVASYYQMD